MGSGFRSADCKNILDYYAYPCIAEYKSTEIAVTDSMLDKNCAILTENQEAVYVAVKTMY